MTASPAPDQGRQANKNEHDSVIRDVFEWLIDRDAGFRSQVLVDEVILAYARLDGDLPEEDGSFRMVVPGAEGKLNVRMLVELQGIQ